MRIHAIWQINSLPLQAKHFFPAAIKCTLDHRIVPWCVSTISTWTTTRSAGSIHCIINKSSDIKSTGSSRCRKITTQKSQLVPYCCRTSEQITFPKWQIIKQKIAPIIHHEIHEGADTDRDTSVSKTKDSFEGQIGSSGRTSKSIQEHKQTFFTTKHAAFGTCHLFWNLETSH